MKINEPGDAFECEADQVADAVSAGRRISGWSLARLGSRQIQRKAEAGAGRLESPAWAKEAPDSSGHPLDRETRRHMESCIGYDFSKVRIHNGVRASESASALGAQAYAVGNHIVFGAGRYSPQTAEGMRLIAHELAHTVQQQGNAAAAVPSTHRSTVWTHVQRTGNERERHELPGPAGEPPARPGPTRTATTDLDPEEERRRRSVLALVEGALHSPSRPLLDGESRWARHHFGQDLTHVRLHMNTEAGESARAVRSFGYTVGQHIVLDPARYRPESPAGRWLLGHELTHVLQQFAAPPLPAGLSGLKIGSSEDLVEQQAEYHARTPGSVAPLPTAGLVLRRAPQQGDLAKAVCEATANPPKEEVGECNYARPENCPTYESWIQTFIRLKSFVARATPEPGKPNVDTPNAFKVLGEAAATRFPDKFNKESLADPKAAPTPTTQVKPGEGFIDHPTDAWVKTCLPENLRATAYQLPTDCADIAIVLRHVWLAAHHRTQILLVDKKTYVIGDEAGGAKRSRALRAIVDIGSEVTSLVQQYSDAQGTPLLTFRELTPLLHPGDVLVWEHHDHGLDKPPTGGHVLTITDVTRRDDGSIEGMSFLQGNEPIFGSEVPTTTPEESDDKTKIIQKLKVKDTREYRAALGHAPGRRIEAASTTDPLYRSLITGDPDLEVSAGRKRASRRVWGWGSRTILAAAGPPKAVTRPPAAKPAKGAKRERRLTDWIPSFNTARSYADWQAAWEAMVLESRAFVEQGRDIPQDQAARVGEAAGNRLRSLSKHAKGTLGDESHFTRLQEAKSVLEAVGTSRDPSRPVSRDLSAPTDRTTTNLLRTLRWIGEALELAAHGGSSNPKENRGQ